MCRTFEFRVSTQLAASAAEVWAHAATIAGVNRELFPLARMTCPDPLARLDGPTMVPGVFLFRSWILLFGFLPVDYDDLTIESLDPAGGFQENSVLLSQSRWRHARALRSIPGGSVITDHVEFTPRIALLGPLYRLVFLAIFRWRHRRLKRLFGALA